MTDQNDVKPDDPARALREPFRLPADWDPIIGRCSRCGGRALLVEDRWWHDGTACDPRRATAPQFLPDSPEGGADA